MTTNEYTAYAVQTLRNRLGISQEKLARKLDVSVKTVCRYESGQCTATGRAAVALARVCGELKPDDYRAELEKFFNECAGNRTLLLKQKAAKEMYEALKVMLASAHPNKNDHPTMTAAWKQAQAALDKAEGK